jgi:hypothetical protein
MTNTQTFLLALGTGSALIAFWVAIRFPDRAPGDFRRAMLHVGAAMAIGYFAGDIFGALVQFGMLVTFSGIFVIVMPVLIYTFLSTAWFLKLAHDQFNRYSG